VKSVAFYSSIISYEDVILAVFFSIRPTEQYFSSAILIELSTARALMAKPRFEMRLSRTRLKTNAAIFDQKEATFNFFPSESLLESPVIWTNHPSFISMCQDHFEKIWKTAREYKLENKNNQN
jgi:hypothetical protein